MVRQGHPDAVPALKHRPLDTVRHRFGQRLQHGVAPRSVDRDDPLQVLLEETPTQELAQRPLQDRRAADLPHLLQSHEPVAESGWRDDVANAHARRFKAMFGGGFRQAGIVAAGALHAIEHHRARLAEDHAKAKAFAEGLNRTPGIEIDLELVQTNIVRFTVTAMPSGTFVERCHADSLHMLASGPDGVRAILHLDVSEAQIQEALAIVESVVSN